MLRLLQNTECKAIIRHKRCHGIFIYIYYFIKFLKVTLKKKIQKSQPLQI